MELSAVKITFVDGSKANDSIIYQMVCDKKIAEISFDANKVISVVKREQTQRLLLFNSAYDEILFLPA